MWASRFQADFRHCTRQVCVQTPAPRLPWAALLPEPKVCKPATATARFGTDGITLCDPNCASEGTSAVFRSFTSSQFELLSATIRHHQEPPLYRTGLDCFKRSVAFPEGEEGGGLSVWPSIISFPTLAAGSSALAGGL